MKKVLLFSFFTFSILLSKGQNFFKASKERFQNDISLTEVKVNEQVSKILELTKLAESLNVEGNISPENFADLGVKLNIEKVTNNVSKSKIEALKKLMLSENRVKRNMQKLQREVVPFKNKISNEWYAKFVEYQKLEKEIRSSSMGGEKKTLKTLLEDASKQHEEALITLDTISSIAERANVEGRIDSVTAKGVGERVQGFIEKIKETEKEIKTLEASIFNTAEFSSNSAAIKVKVYALDSTVKIDAKKREYNIKMIEEGIKKSTKTLFSLAAFFGPGGYLIPEDKMEKARVYFSPLVDEMVKFSNKYSETPRTATVLVNGYADATQITKGSPLYNELTAYLKIANPTKEELNKALSSLRAEKLSELFSKLIKAKSSNFVAWPKIVFENIEVGRGEELPVPTITYKANDERRRIVIVYWSVLPN